jgi:ketosteroid isomerase-like protein
MKQLILSLVTIVFFTISCQEKYSSSEDEKVINNLVNEWETNGTIGNRAANAEFFTDDGIRVQGGKTYRGKEAIRSLFSAQQEQNTYLSQENKIEKIWSSEDFITVASTRTVSYINVATGDTLTTSVPAINVFERQPDGSLKLAYSMKD